MSCIEKRDEGKCTRVGIMRRGRCGGEQMNKKKIRVPIQRNAFRVQPLAPTYRVRAPCAANKFNPLSYGLDSVVIFSLTVDFSHLTTSRRVNAYILCIYFSFVARKMFGKLLLLSGLFATNATPSGFAPALSVIDN